MATHSSILAWGIPWMEKPGRLQSIGLWRVGHNWMTNALTHQGICYCLGINSVPKWEQHHGLPWCSDGKESACGAGDPGSISGSRRSLGGGMASPSSILAWRIPETEENGELQSWGTKEVDIAEWLTLTFQIHVQVEHRSSCEIHNSVKLCCTNGSFPPKIECIYTYNTLKCTT